MIQYRNLLFETNSSSTHSLTLPEATSGLDYTGLNKLITKTTLTVPVISQPDITELGATNDPQVKFRYLITYLLIKEQRKVLIAQSDKMNIYLGKDGGVYGCSRYTKNEFNAVLTALKNICKINFEDLVIPASNQPIIWDHQTTPFESKFPVDLTDPHAIIMYIFDPNIGLNVQNTLIDKSKDIEQEKE